MRETRQKVCFKIKFKAFTNTPDKSALKACECTGIHSHPDKSGHELQASFAPILTWYLQWCGMLPTPALARLKWARN